MINFEQSGEFKAIRYNDDILTLPVYKIPLDQLIYNKYNGRIKSIVLSYELGLSRKLNAQIPNDKSIIEAYLFDSAEHRNEKTLQSLKRYGQQEVGIVTADMIIIDGNRRASLLNKLHREGNRVDFFKAVILPDSLADNEVEIIKLETNYQMGVDNKVEYKPIEKYLRCRELLIKFQISINEVSDLMSEKPSRIQQWMDILALMDEYLEYLKSANVYTRLDKKEGHFVDLYNYLKKYEHGHFPREQLKIVYFDYIRLGIPVQRARIIGNPRGSQSLFSQANLWDDFYSQHEHIKADFKEAVFNSLKDEHPEKSNEEIFVTLDDNFKEKLNAPLLSNLVDGEIKIKQLKEFNNKVRELNRILNYIQKFKVEEIESSDEELINSLLKEISRVSLLKSEIIR